MSVSGNIRMSVSLANTLAGVDLSTPQENINESLQKSITSGVVYHARIDLADGGSSNIDLGDDSLSDVFGNTVNIITVSGIYISAVSTNTTDVTVSTGTNSIFPTLPVLSAGEGFAYIADIDTTTDAKLYFSNAAGAAASIDVIVTGVES